MTCQVVKQVDDVACEPWIAREEPDVGIQSGGAHVVIPGPNVRVTAQPGRLLAHNQRRLGMRLQAAHPKDDMGASPCQLSGPVQIALLVEPGHEFNDARHLFARFGSLDQGSNKGCVIANPIDGHFDRNGQRIVRGRAYEVFYAGIKAVIRVVYEQIIGPDDGKDVGMAVREGWQGQRAPGGVPEFREGQASNFEERGVVDLVGHIVEVHG